MDMKCPICFGKLLDVGDGYECKECGYFLEYDEIDEYDCEEYDVEEYEEYYIDDDDFCDLKDIDED
jgi:tRNA(Ile2) C34 agmatinyltransferase TiaS